ncbi:unnamed protein product [Phaedon cochleariae]|uniref:Gustatory receptor n=1 Tax=Phaedon cochleariae TaxID=80249 RepID=A0A9P0GVL8_PHACE|nr:unnamed protein product [Phaedon cochleariae]
MALFVTGFYIHIFITKRKQSEDTHVLDTVFKEVYYLLVSSTILISLIINCKKYGLITRALNQIAQVDIELKNMGLSPNHNKYKNYITVYVILTILPVVVSEYFECNMIIFSTENPTLNCYTLCCFTFIIKAMERTLFTSYILLMKDRFEILNKELSTMSNLNLESTGWSRQLKVIYVRPFMEKNKLKSLRKLHDKLCSVGKMINEYFSFQLLLLIGITFMEFTNWAHLCIGRFREVLIGKLDIKSTIMLFMMPVSSIGSIVLLCIICTVLKNEVHKTGDILFEVKNEHDFSVVKEVSLFSLFSH